MRAASMTAVRPDRHTLLIEDACTSQPMPAPIAAWRAGFWPAPAGSTCPTRTASTTSGLIPAFSSAPRIAMLPSAVDGSDDSCPFNRPCGVRAAPTMTTSSWFMPPP